MNRKPVWFEAKSRNFQETPNGVQWEAVIFSSEFNRNSAYFDIHKLARWAKKLNKVMMNNNHDGKYFSAVTDKITSIEVTTDENGITECFAVVESTNKEKRESPEMVTGFSIELMVEAKNVISNENGEYYIDYEWVGMAYLISGLAGSGDTRLLSMKTFNQKINNNMTEGQIKVFLAEQKEELQKEFSDKLEAQAKEFAATQEDLIRKNQVDTKGTCSWVGDNGEIYTKSWQDIYTSVLTVLGNTDGDAESPEVMAFKAKFGLPADFSLKLKKFEEESKAEEIEPEEVQEAPADEDLTKIENALNTAESLKKQMSLGNKEEEQVNLNGDVTPPALSPSEAQFKLKQSITNSL